MVKSFVEGDSLVLILGQQLCDQVFGGIADRVPAGQIKFKRDFERHSDCLLLMLAIIRQRP